MSMIVVLFIKDLLIKKRVSTKLQTRIVSILDHENLLKKVESS